MTPRPSLRKFLSPTCTDLASLMFLKLLISASTRCCSVWVYLFFSLIDFPDDLRQSLSMDHREKTFDKIMCACTAVHTGAVVAIRHLLISLQSWMIANRMIL